MATTRAFITRDSLDQATQDAIEAGNIEKLADYDDRILIEVDEGDLADIRSRGSEATALERDREVRLRVVAFDTQDAIPETPERFRLPESRRARHKTEHVIVQFVGPPKPEWIDAVKSTGAIVRSPIPENAVLVSMTPEQRLDVEALPEVTWVGYYEPVYKLSPAIVGRRTAVAPNDLGALEVDPSEVADRPDGNLSVRVHDPSDRAYTARRIRDMGGTVLRSDGKTVVASLAPEKLPDIAMLEQVAWIEPAPQNELGNDVASGIITVEPVRTDHGLTGRDQTVAVADTGLDTGVDDNTMHEDFRNRIVAIHDRAGDGADDTNGHGTHVAGSVLGDGSASNGAIQGMAVDAEIVVQQLRNSAGSLSGIPADLNTLFQQAYDDGARIHSNSWGNVSSATRGNYTSSSVEIDEFVWDNKDMCILFLVHNMGEDADSDGVVDTDSVCPQACAKNCISVGASENVRATGGLQSDWGTAWSTDFPANPVNSDHPSDDAEGMAAFSGRGPVDDGRIKPDVVAPGSNILSVRSSQTTGDGWGRLPTGDPNRADYYYMGGTSMATPITAGTVALIREYLTKVHLVTSPPAALLKAVLIHGAHEMAGQHPGPDNDVGPVPDDSQGWGRVDLSESLYPDDPTHWSFRADPNHTLATNDVRSYDVHVVDGSVPLRATLVWTDAPSTAAAGGGLVNELRLEVVSPTGTVVQGDPANNNVQQVVIDNPQTGDWVVRVRGVNVRTVATDNERQDFAVVWSGGLRFVDLYIRDNPADEGRPPSSGSLCHSPDLLVRLTDDPLDPTVANPEYGQTNYVFVTVNNRGTRAANGARVRLFWARPGVNLSRPHWMTDGIKVGATATNQATIDVPPRTAAGPGQAHAVFAWDPPDPASNTVDPGHFCLFATVDHDDDPLMQEDVHVVRWEDNLAWRNLFIQDLMANGETGVEFYVSGKHGQASIADLRFDRSGLPANGTVTVKLPSRYVDDADVRNLTEEWRSAGGRVCRVIVDPPDTGDIQGIALESRENTLVRLVVTLPPTAVDGELYPVFVEQTTDGIVTGRVTLLARTVGTPTHIGNRSSAELHLANCEWVDLMADHNKVPYDEAVDLALSRGYNGCRFCMPEVDTD